MKYSKDLLILQSVLFSVYSLYNIYKQNKKIKEFESDIEIILKTHNGYMEVQELQQKAIKDLYRNKKVKEQLKRVIDKEDIPQTKFWDDMAEDDWCDNK